MDEQTIDLLKARMDALGFTELEQEMTIILAERGRITIPGFTISPNEREGFYLHEKRFCRISGLPAQQFYDNEEPN